MVQKSRKLYINQNRESPPHPHKTSTRFRKIYTYISLGFYFLNKIIIAIATANQRFSTLFYMKLVRKVSNCLHHPHIICYAGTTSTTLILGLFLSTFSQQMDSTNTHVHALTHNHRNTHTTQSVTASLSLFFSAISLTHSLSHKLFFLFSSFISLSLSLSLSFFLQVCLPTFERSVTDADNVFKNQDKAWKGH